MLLQDLYSYRKEYLEDGAKHNCVTMVMNDPSIAINAGDLQSAIDYTTSQFSVALGRFAECKKQLPLWSDSDIHKKVERYTETMMDLVVGNIQWSIACKLYSLFENEESMKIGLVTM